MAYVWVDCDCDDGSDKIAELESLASDAYEMLRSGDADGAMQILGLICGDREARRKAEHEKELLALFTKWKDAGRPSGFLDWAHSKRKASLT